MLDLGCVPGAWLQVAAQAIGPPDAGGLVLGVDIQPPAVPAKVRAVEAAFFVWCGGCVVGRSARGLWRLALGVVSSLSLSLSRARACTQHNTPSPRRRRPVLRRPRKGAAGRRAHALGRDARAVRARRERSWACVSCVCLCVGVGLLRGGVFLAAVLVGGGARVQDWGGSRGASTRMPLHTHPTHSHTPSHTHIGL